MLQSQQTDDLASLFDKMEDEDFPSGEQDTAEGFMEQRHTMQQPASSKVNSAHKYKNRFTDDFFDD